MSCIYMFNLSNEIEVHQEAQVTPFRCLCLIEFSWFKIIS